MNCSPITTEANPSAPAIGANFLAKSAKASGAEALGYASEEEQESMMSQFGHDFEKLTQEAKRKLIPVLEWLVTDGRPETDPRNGDPWWAECERVRLASERAHSQAEQAA